MPKYYDYVGLKLIAFPFPAHLNRGKIVLSLTSLQTVLKKRSIEITHWYVEFKSLNPWHIYVANYKLLGVYLNEDLSWNTHIDYIFKKACKRLYSLRILKRAGVASLNILKVYLTIIRPILEYAVPVWQSISGTWSDKLETILEKSLENNLSVC